MKGSARGPYGGGCSGGRDAAAVLSGAPGVASRMTRRAPLADAACSAAKLSAVGSSSSRVHSRKSLAGVGAGAQAGPRLGSGGGVRRRKIGKGRDRSTLLF
jgi:hypothetical protein